MAPPSEKGRAYCLCQLCVPNILESAGDPVVLSMRSVYRHHSQEAFPVQKTKQRREPHFLPVGTPVVEVRDTAQRLKDSLPCVQQPPYPLPAQNDAGEVAAIEDAFPAPQKPGDGDGGLRMRCFGTWTPSGARQGEWRSCNSDPSVEPLLQGMEQDVLNAVLHRFKHNASGEAVIDHLRLVMTRSGASYPVPEQLRPKEYRQCLTFLEQRGILEGKPFVGYDLCPCGFLYRCTDKGRTSCTCCNKPRKESLKLLYRPISDWLTSHLEDPATFQMLQHGNLTQQQRGSVPGFACDILDTLPGLGDNHHTDSMTLHVGVHTDGVNPFKFKSSYSMWPLVLTLYNISPDYRYRPGLIGLCGIIPGKRDESGRGGSVPIHDVLALLAEELTMLNTEGLPYTHPVNGMPAVAKVQLQVLGGDYRAVEKVVGITGAPTSVYSCFKCWHPGTWGPSKYLYGQFFRYLSKASPLRRLSADLNNAIKWSWRKVPGAASMTGPRKFDVDDSTIVRAAWNSQALYAPERTQEDLVRQIKVPEIRVDDDTDAGPELTTSARGSLSDISSEYFPDDHDDDDDVDDDDEFQSADVDDSDVHSDMDDDLFHGIPPNVQDAEMQQPNRSWRDRLLTSVPGFSTRRGLQYDPMHTIGQFIAQLFDLIFTSSRVTDRIKGYEVGINNRTLEPCVVSKDDQITMQAITRKISKDVPKADGGGPRLAGTIGGSGVKMSVWCFWASPYGAYVLEHAKSLRPIHRMVLQQILCSVSYLLDDAIPLCTQEELLDAVAHALSLMEIYLPSTELDIKAHNLLHLVERLFTLGPSYTTAMWGYEALMGRLVKLVKKTDSPEVTVMRSWYIIERALKYAYRNQSTVMLDGILPKGVAVTKEIHSYWTWRNEKAPSVEPLRIDGAGGLRLLASLSSVQRSQLHEMYIQHDPRYKELWAAFLEWLWAQWPDHDTSAGSICKEVQGSVPLCQKLDG
ncbi:Idaten transposition protein [Volvox carteri f. nagariensis]|uniref:Idaten transposition protein n=1 Tax=Volvox carteri f. nagariensis TaxID=3068 RepID=D8UKH9_VOLCA|nr:Idaten transposition protein [Volvox carteri f. nagariensis]EFJ39776.1 Idaten transposition protein [Volvox carteri f. nagariensis]|eukprot:XP_002959153.1 Idaten transposition protein [Volvox carteri f. nagariensis]